MTPHPTLPSLLYAAVATAALVAACGENCDEETSSCSVNVELVNRSRGGAPSGLVWAVYREGDGPWQRLDHPAGRYSISVGHGSDLTVAFVCESTMMGEVIHMAAEEIGGIDVFCGVPYSNPARLVNEWSGAIRGVGEHEQVTLVFGSFWEGSQSIALPAGASRYAVRVPEFQVDLVAVLESPVRPPRFILRHNLIAHQQPGMADLDFDAGVVVPEQRLFTPPPGLPGEVVQVGVNLITKESARLPVPMNVIGRIPLLPRKDLGPVDVQELWVSALSPAGMRGVLHWVGDEPLPEVTLPPALASIELSYVATSPTVRPRAVLAEGHPEASFYQLLMSPQAASPSFTWVINAGARWLARRGRQAQRTVELPELHTIPGFNPTWAPDPGTPQLVELAAVRSTRPFHQVISDAWPRYAGAPSPPTGVTTYAKTFSLLPPAAPPRAARSP